MKEEYFEKYFSYDWRLIPPKLQFSIEEVVWFNSSPKPVEGIIQGVRLIRMYDDVTHGRGWEVNYKIKPKNSGPEFWIDGKLVFKTKEKLLKSL